MNPINMYRETSIKTAGQGKLIVLLYDKAITSIDKAVKLLDGEDKQLDLVNNSIIRAQEIITELSASLDFDRGKDIASNLFSLYIYFNQQLMTANIEKDSSHIKPVLTMLQDLRSAWKKIENTKDQSPSNSLGIDVAG